MGLFAERTVSTIASMPVLKIAYRYVCASSSRGSPRAKRGESGGTLRFLLFHTDTVPLLRNSAMGIKDSSIYCSQEHVVHPTPCVGLAIVRIGIDPGR